VKCWSFLLPDDSLECTLPVAHIEPLVEFVSNFAEMCNFPESKFFMQRYTGRVGQRDHRDDLVHSKGAYLFKQGAVQGPPDAAPGIRRAKNKWSFLL